MRFVGINMVLATWLLVSAFALPHTAATAALTIGCAFAVPIFAVVATGRPAVRFVITFIAALLAGTALLLPGMPGLSALSNGVVAALLAALSLVSPVEEPEASAGAAGRHAG